MSSFIDLMKNDVWSEADIKTRLHAEIRSEISEQSEAELNRALQGKILGMHTMTPGEMALLMAFKMATDRVALLGVQARADMALLAETMALESATARLARESAPDSPEDDAGRAAAEAVVTAASPQAQALHRLRNPVAAPVAGDA